MNWIEQIFATLEIEPTKDKKAIKKAYAQQVKRFHPEEYPNEWKKLHDAYETALHYAEGETKRSIPLLDNVVHNEISLKGYEEESSEEAENKEVENKEVENKEVENKEVENKETKNDKESNYNDLFEYIQDEELHRRKSEIEAAKKRFNFYAEQGENLTYIEWKSYLQSTFFLSACYEEEFLRYLSDSMRKVKLEQSILILFIDTAQVLESNFKISMELSKVKLAQEIQEICKSIYTRTTINRMEAHKKNEKKIDKKRIFVSALIIIIALFFIGRPFFDKSTNNSYFTKNEIMLTVEDAKKEAVYYLNTKYPDENYQEADIEIKEYQNTNLDMTKIFGFRSLGYKGTINDSNHTEIIIAIVTDIETKKEKLLCFDNHQEKEIVQDLQVEITALTGLEGGTVFLSSEDKSPVSCYINTSAYHTYYNGDLESFFTEEANYRKKIYITTDEGKYEYLKNINKRNMNGACSVYFPDSENATITKRLENINVDNNRMKEVLQNLSDAYQIQMMGALIPQEFFQELMLNVQKDTNLEVYDWIKRGGNADKDDFNTLISSLSPPLISPLVSSWYISKNYDDNTELNQEEYLNIQGAVIFSDGIYAIDKYINDTGKQDSILSNTTHTSQVRMVEMPEEMNKYLEENSIDAQNTINFDIILDDSEYPKTYILAIDKAKIGIPKSDYQVAITIPKTEYSDAEYNILKVKDYTDVNTNYEPVACENEQYLFLEYTVGTKAETPCTITIIP